MKSKYTIIFTSVIVVSTILLGIFFLPPLLSRLRCGHTQIEGLLELRAYPKTSETAPTILVYVVVPMYDNYEIYLTENGMPLSYLDEFTKNDLVAIEGVLYSRDAIGVDKTYWMIEIFDILQGD